MTPLISVLIPTVGDREDLLQECASAYRDEHRDEVEILTIEGHTWGAGCNALAEFAQGDYWLFACDDTKPQPDWFVRAASLVDRGLTPASRYFQRDGSPLHASDLTPHGAPVAWCRSFLLTPARYAEVGPLIDATWYSDVDYSERLRAHGYEIVGCDGFSFTHLHGERGWLTPEVAVAEEAAYLASHERIERGEKW
jgi:GT2 family glycosyltransferase